MAPYDLLDVHAETSLRRPASAYTPKTDRRIAAYQQTLLTEAIAAGVIPQLMRLKERHQPRLDVTRAELAEFASDLVIASPEPARACVALYRARGWTAERIYLDLFGPAAELLGEGWKDDTWSFADVTLGMGRLQKLVHEIGAGSPPRQHGPLGARRILLCTLAGETHSFGLTILSELFAQSGWDVRVRARIAPGDLASTVKSEWLEVVGLSAAIDAQVPMVASAIKVLRRVSRNPALGIIVGGGVFNAQPGLAQKIGADRTAADARDAVKQAGRLLAQPMQIV